MWQQGQDKNRCLEFEQLLIKYVFQMKLVGAPVPLIPYALALNITKLFGGIR